MPSCITPLPNGRGRRRARRPRRSRRRRTRRLRPVRSASASCPASPRGRPGGARPTSSAPATAPACSAYSASLEHRQATVGAAARERLGDRGRVDRRRGRGRARCRPPGRGWRRSATRAVCAAAGPSAARKTRGRAPVAARCASERARSASNASSRRTRGSPPRGRRRVPAARSTGSSARFGNSLTPVIGSRRCARSAAAPAQVAGEPLGDQTGAQRGGLAARPLDLLEQRPGRVGEFVGEPLDVPGAARRVDDPGQVRLLQQDRRGVAGDAPGEAVGQAEAWSKGSTVTASAPPTPAPRQATVVRSMFTHGSRRVIITGRGDRVLALRAGRR